MIKSRVIVSIALVLAVAFSFAASHTVFAQSTNYVTVSPVSPVPGQSVSVSGYLCNAAYVYYWPTGASYMLYLGNARLSRCVFSANVIFGTTLAGVSGQLVVVTADSSSYVSTAVSVGKLAPTSVPRAAPTVVPQTSGHVRIVGATTNFNPDVRKVEQVFRDLGQTVPNLQIVAHAASSNVSMYGWSCWTMDGRDTLCPGWGGDSVHIMAGNLPNDSMPYYSPNVTAAHEISYHVARCRDGCGGDYNGKNEMSTGPGFMAFCVALATNAQQIENCRHV